MKGKNAGNAEVFVELGKVQGFNLRLSLYSSVCGIAARYFDKGCGGAFIKSTKNLIEPRQIEIRLNMNKLKIERRLVRLSPRERISVERPATEIHVDVELLLFGNDCGIEPRRGGELVPE